MKKFIGVVIGVVVVFMLTFCYTVNNMKYYGLDKIATYDDFIEYTKDIRAELDDTDAEQFKDYEEKAFEYLESIDGETSIFVAKAGSEFRLKSAGAFQNVQIERVIQGEPALCGKEIQLITKPAIRIYDKMQEDIFVCTLPYVNVMKPGNRYLVFCEETEISRFLEIPLFRITLSGYSMLNIDKDDEHAISDWEMITFIIDDYEEKAPVAPYCDLINQEFMGTSDETLEVFLSAKRKLLEKYNLR